MPFVELATHRIHYQVTHQVTHQVTPQPENDVRDVPVLLVMGLGFSSRAWDTLPPRLAAHRRVITFDNRGTGKSTLPRGAFRIRDMADDAARVLDALAVDRAHVFGISMGGMIAIELAIGHASRVASLALGCTHAGYLRSTQPSLMVLAKLLRVAFSSRSLDAERSASFLVSDAWYAADPSAFERWIATVDQGPPRSVLAQMRAILLHATERRLSQITAPTLVITGDTDRLVPPSNSRSLAKKIAHARLVELAGAGHCFPVERETETVEALGELFGENEPRAPTPDLHA